MTVQVAGDLTETQDQLLTFFEEKDLPYRYWTLTDQAGTNHMLDNEFIQDLVIFETTEEDRKKIQKTLIGIDFKNGDINQYLRDLGQFFIDAKVDREQEQEQEEEQPWEIEYIKPYNRINVIDKESQNTLFIIKGKDVGKVFHNEFDSLDQMQEYVIDQFGEEIQNLYN